MLLVIALLSSLANGGIGARSADQLATEATRSFASAPVVHRSGSFTRANHHYAVELSESKRGDAQGLVTQDGLRFELRSVDGRAYVRAGQDYWKTTSDAQLARVFDGQWVYSSVVSVDVSEAVLRESLSALSLLDVHGTDLRKGPRTRVGSADAVRLTDARGDVYVSASTPVRILRIVSKPGYTTSDGLSGVDLRFDYPSTLSVTKPEAFLDPENPRTLPALFLVETDSLRFTNCTSTSAGCAMTATVRNRRGQSGGQPRADFHLTRDGGGDLGSCSAPIKPVPYDQTQEVSCTVSSPAFAAFQRAGGHINAAIKVYNPIYDD
jgi:hypothetical protein